MVKAHMNIRFLPYNSCFVMNALIYVYNLRHLLLENYSFSTIIINIHIIFINIEIRNYRFQEQETITYSTESQCTIANAN